LAYTCEAMSRKIVLLVTFLLWSLITLPIAGQAGAQVPLTRAIIQQLRNIVRLVPKNQQPRPARLSESLAPDDAIATGRSSQAELRFNDGSVARVGEQAVFRFVPNTRDFRLNNGTLLLVIPPGRGTTRVRTPNAAAGIRGSALFVRYNPDSQTTIIGALTDSNIEVSNKNESQRQGLQAGQMAVIVKDRIERIYEFDLRTFYETSDIVRGLDLQGRTDGKINSDPAIAAVQAETTAAIAAQTPIPRDGSVENPSFVQMPANFNSGNSPTPSIPSPPDNPILVAPPIQGGEVLLEREQRIIPPRPAPATPIKPPITPPQENQVPPVPLLPPPVETPPPPPVPTPPPVEAVTPPPVPTPPPVTPPPVETPPPVTPPPVETPPVTTPPVTTPPVETPPVTTPPVTTPVETPPSSPGNSPNGPPGQVGNPNSGNSSNPTSPGNQTQPPPPSTPTQPSDAPPSNPGQTSNPTPTDNQTPPASSTPTRPSDAPPNLLRNSSDVQPVNNPPAGSNR
jgi:FecR protein